MVRWASLAASTASFVVVAGAAQAQTSRDPVQFPSYDASVSAAPIPEERRPPEQSLTIRPRVGVRALVTDNVYLTDTQHKTDLITNPFVGVTLRTAGPRSTGRLDLDAGYDSYSRAHRLNGFTYAGYGAGEYDIIRQALLFEALGSVSNGSVSSFGEPARDRSGVGDRAQIINLAAGPRLNTTVGNLFDLTASAIGAWVGYSAADASTATPPQDATIRSAAATATTGGRYRSHELMVNASYQADDNDFTSYYGLVSLFVPINQDFRVLARAGADDISQPGVVDLQAPIWSVGLEYDLNAKSYIRLEGGRRYHENSYAAEVRVDMTDRFYVIGTYMQRILPPQMAINDAFLGFAASSQTLPPALTETNFGITGPLFSETSRDKVANLRAVYVWPDQQIAVSGSWIERRLLASNTEEKSYAVTTSYSRRMRPDLRGDLSLTYERNLGSDVAATHNRRWTTAATLIYDLNTSVQINGGYAYSNDKQTTGAGVRIVENILFASLTKSF